jgi:hypothetical protein
MADIGYHQPRPGIYGTANPATDSSPESRAALQERYAALATAAASAPGAVPWSYERLGGGNVAKIGWTAQSGTGSPFPPYTAEYTGRVPDWEDDGNSVAAGRYDQNQAWGPDHNPLNRAPIGGEWIPNDEPNPNAPTTDVSGTIDLEW